MMGRSKKWFQGLEKMHLKLPQAQKEEEVTEGLDRGLNLHIHPSSK